jgi:hypothetical protein
MKRSRLLPLGLGFLALAGLGGYEASVLSHQREQLHALGTTAAQLRAALAKLQREHLAATADLALAERQLAALPITRAPVANLTPQREIELSVWLGQVKQLRRLFDERPDQRIPELSLLTERDWLRDAKTARLDSEDGIRQALARLRDSAITAFQQSQLSPALRKFAKTAADDATPTIFALTPFFDAPVDPTMLGRYELGSVKNPSSRGSLQWRIQPLAPVDPDYDRRQQITASREGNYGSSSAGALYAWIPDFQERMQRAQKSFSAAKPGTQPTGYADVLPFVDPPFPPATVEKILKADRERPR